MARRRMTSWLRGFGCCDRELQPQIGLLVWPRLCGAQAQAGVVSATTVRHTGSSARSLARKLHPGGQTASTFRPQEGAARGDGGHLQLRHLSSPVSIYIPSTTPTRHCQQQMMLRLPHLCPAIPLLPWFVLCTRTPLPLAILAHGRRLTVTWIRCRGCCATRTKTPSAAQPAQDCGAWRVATALPRRALRWNAAQAGDLVWLSTATS